MKITKVAALAGISVRTLHYYDELGLLSPSRNADNNRREYTGNDFLKLHQILYFKQLGIPLLKIKAMMEDPHYDKVAAWNQQIADLELEKAKLTRQIQAIADLVKLFKHGDIDLGEDLYSSIFVANNDSSQQLAQHLWGNTIETPILDAMPAEFRKDIADAMRHKMNQLSTYSDLPVDSAEVRQQIYDFHIFLNQSQGNLYTLEVFKRLGDYYVENNQFRENLEAIKPGFSNFMRDAIYAYVALKK